MDLRANTAADVLIGPFVDSTDGNTTEDGLTLAQADIKLSKNGQALTQKNDDTTAVFDDDGYYNCEFNATDVNAEGQLVLIVHKAGALPVRHEFDVLSEAAWDSLYAAKDAGFMDVNIKTVGRADAQETEANNLESACSNYSATRGLTGTAVPAVAADGAFGLPISDAGGLDLDTLLGVLTSLAAETRSANLLDQLKTIIAVIESQREHHTHQPGTGSILFVDETNGATTGSGATGGVSDPIDTWQDAHDTYGTNGGHDLYIMVAGLGSSTTVHTEDIAPTNRYSLTRGPGRDLTWRPTANNTVAITVTNTDGCMFSGFQLDVSAAGTGSQNGIEVSGSDFFHASGIWFNATRGDALQITNCDNYRVTNNVLQSSGASGSGHGIQVLAGSGQTASYGKICDNQISDVQGDGIQVNTTGGGAVESALICDNIIHGSTDDGIDLVDSGAVDTIIARNVIGNSGGSNIEDAGTTSIIANNEQWAKQSLLVYGHFSVHIDDVDGAAGSVEGENGTQGNPVDNLADLVLLAAGLGIKDYDLHGSTAITLVSAHANWHFTGHNGSSVDPDGQNVNGSHFECLTLTGDLGGDDVTARHCKLQSLTNLTGVFDFCLLEDNATLVAGDTYFFQCASGVAGTGTPYIDVDGDDANARDLHVRGWMGGVELRTHTSTDTTSFDCPAGQLIVANSGTGGTIAARGNINITDNASGAVTIEENAAVNMSKINAEAVDALNVDTYAEPGRGAPPATASLIAKIGYLYKAWRNKGTQTATEQKLFADDGSTVDQKATVSDDATTFTKGEMGTGP